MWLQVPGPSLEVKELRLAMHPAQHLTTAEQLAVELVQQVARGLQRSTTRRSGISCYGVAPGIAPGFSVSRSLARSQGRAAARWCEPARGLRPRGRAFRARLL